MAFFVTAFVIIAVITPWGVGHVTSACLQFRNNRCVRQCPKFSCTIANLNMSHAWQGPRGNQVGMNITAEDKD